MSTASLPSSSDFLFPSDSAIWHINRERALLLTGTRVLLMQVAHPMIAESVYNHSYVFQKPLLRLQRTLSLTLTLVYGTRAEVQHALAEIDRAHRQATGRIDGTIGKHKEAATYNPRNPQQARWVFATLVEGAITGYECLLAPLSAEKKQAFYEDSRFIAEQMGVRRSYLPAHYEGLLELMRQEIAEEVVIVSDKARKIAPFLTVQHHPLLRVVAYPGFRLAVGLLPQSIRAQYGYHLRPWEETLQQGFCAASRALVPLLPGVLRYAPQYRRARRLRRNA